MAQARGSKTKRRLVAVLTTAALVTASFVAVGGVSPAGAVAGVADHLEVTTQPGNGTAGSPLSTQPVVTIRDSTNATVATDNTTPITLQIKPGSGATGAVLACTANPVTVVAGVATFAGCNINLAATGYKLIAVDAVHALSVESTTFKITPGTAAKLAFSQQPGNGTAGSPLVTSPIVEVQDQFGNTVTTGPSSTATVNLAIQTGTGVLTCTSTLAVLAVAGVATFTGCQVSLAGIGKTLIASSILPVTPVLTSAISAAFNVSGGPAVAVVFVQQPGGGTPSGVWGTQPWAAVVDATGAVVTTDNATTVQLVITGPLTPLACTTNPLSVTDGVAKFNGCNIDVPGTYTLSTGSLPNLVQAVSAPFKVGVLHLEFTTQPGNGIAGSPLSPQPVVTLKDANGITVTTFDSEKVALTKTVGTPVAGGPGLLTCATNPLKFTNGVAAFSGCMFDTAGTGYKLTATAASVPPGISTVSAAFNVFGPATKLVFTTQPGNGTAGSPLSVQPVVKVQDAAGNVVTTDNTTLVTLTKTALTPLTGGPGTLTCAPKVAEAGVATFSGCSISTVGTGYKLTATSSPVLTPATSSAFDVTGALKLVFTTQPGNGAPGIPLGVQPVVAVEDAANAVVTTDNTTVVTLTKTPLTPVTGGPGVLTCPAKTVVAGVATFAGCSIDTVGTGYKLTATSSPVLTPATSSAFNISVAPQRIYGADAIDTSIAISQRAFPTADSANAVVLARSDFFSDALAGGPLAAAAGAPLLITPGAPVRSSLDPRVQDEIERVLPSGRTVYVLGGTLALAPGIDTTLTGLGYTVVRVAGANLFATAVAIAEQLGNRSTVFEATGLNFPDALSAVPAAIRSGGAILLTNGATQAPETAAYLAAHPPSTRYAIGGPLAAAGADPSATAVYGDDLFGTSAAVAGRFFALASVYGVATGLNYPDALSGGVFMATGGRLGPVLLVNTNAPLPPTISAYLASLADGTPGYVFGGPIAVANSVIAAIVAVVG